jgi:hypothetical protein
VQVVGVAWWAVMRIVVGVGDLMRRTRYDHTDRILGGPPIRRSGNVVCGLHRARGDNEHMFFGSAP